MSLFAASDLPPGVALQRGVARDPAILAAVRSVILAAPFRTMVTPRGPMSVRMTNCGALGWVSDARGYRYAPVDPLTQAPWPEIPDVLRALARRCAHNAGFPDFNPDACLVNQYLPGTQMGLHQDKDERDFTQPVVSVSLGLPARFTIGGATRKDPTFDIRIEHGDVVVFGGPARRMLHGVKRIEPGHHPELGSERINLTFRRAG
jgi:alkylated DNA repair protein (DNA oxidative demethylase)